MKKEIAFLKVLLNVWTTVMYAAIILVTLLATQFEPVPYLLILVAEFSIAYAGEVLIESRLLALEKRKNKGSFMDKNLTSITEDGDYSLPAENLYEAIEKLGYIEHEMKGGIL